MDIGEKLKNLRLKNELTQEELADRAELSKGFISQVERSLTSPSIATLIDILECLGTNLQAFFNEDKEKIVFKQDDFFITKNETLASEIAWLVPSSIKNNMEPVLLTMSPGGKSQDAQPHIGEIFGYILQGKVELIRGEEKFSLTEGDCFYFKAKAFYAFENTSDFSAEMLLLSSPPSF